MCLLLKLFLSSRAAFTLQRQCRVVPHEASFAVAVQRVVQSFTSQLVALQRWRCSGGGYSAGNYWFSWAFFAGSRGEARGGAGVPCPLGGLWWSWRAPRRAWRCTLRWAPWTIKFCRRIPRRPIRESWTPSGRIIRCSASRGRCRSGRDRIASST